MAASKTIRVLSYGIFILVIGFLTINSLLFTCQVTPYETMVYQTDSLWLHLLVLAAALGLAIFARRWFRGLSLKAERRLTLAAAALLLITLISCVLLSKSFPIFDQYICSNAAYCTIQGDFIHYRDGYYLNYFPFQVPFVLFCIPFTLLTGADNALILQFVNVAAIMGIVYALAECAVLLFGERKLRPMTWIGSLLFLPLIFYSTFIYGTLIGACFLLLGVRQLLLYLTDHRKNRMIWIGLWLTLSTLMKMNYAIGLVAAGILLLLDTLGTKKLFSLVCALGIGALSVGSSKLIVKAMENYTGGNLSQGFPTSSWLMLGLQEVEGKEPGWYNENGYDLYRSTDGDREATDRLAKAEIRKCLERFKTDPAYAASFFYRKTVSQWNEPSFQCLWINEMMRNPERSALVLSLYEGKAGKLLLKWMDEYHWLLLAGVCLWLCLYLKKSSLGALFFPLYAVGGFLFHTLSEGKGQYTMIYFYCLLPYSLYGYLLLLRRINQRFSKALPDETSSVH